ncbi:MGH1-like glycoside hydrolase domain-containing protein [Devosia ginsengisoli]|uniref:MGH1-like glycoside hydrolase domain-containing protein n=1 Tax=Devosia ginsengisoli TaxID=400770 RepID=UPI003CCC7563
MANRRRRLRVLHPPPRSPLPPGRQRTLRLHQTHRSHRPHPPRGRRLSRLLARKHRHHQYRADGPLPAISRRRNLCRLRDPPARRRPHPLQDHPDRPRLRPDPACHPLARSVWNHYSLNHDRAHLARLYAAMARYDAWLTTYRDTRGTGGVEAFCTYDTGHDLSARFWHVPDSPFGNDPTRCDPDNPVLPFIAPDLTANVICQRLYLARIAEELGEDPQPWRDKAQASLKALFTHCYDPDDHFFYDRDRNGTLVRVQSDVLLRVLACEVGDDAFFAEALSRYLLNTAKFFAKYPFTSMALDDPRFDPSFGQNSWSGPSNFLSIIRAAHAFEHHHRHVELTWAQMPVLSALFAMDTFPQTLSPFTGAPGYTEKYAPAILCLLDMVERLCGILPRPDGTLWFTGLVPREATHRHIDHHTAYRRKVDGHTFELLNDGITATLYRDGEKRFTFPHGTRLTTDRSSKLQAITGMVARTVTGTIETPNGNLDVSIGPNEVQSFQNGQLATTRTPDLVPPTYG